MLRPASRVIQDLRKSSIDERSELSSIVYA